MNTATQSSRTKKSGSDRAARERKKLAAVGLLAYAQGFSKTCNKPVKRISVEMQVYGDAETGYFIDLVPEVEFELGAGPLSQPEMVVLMLDPKTGEITFSEMQSV